MIELFVIFIRFLMEEDMMMEKIGLSGKCACACYEGVKFFITFQY